MMTTAELSSCTTKIFNPTAFPVPTPFCWSYAYAYPPTALLTLEVHVISLMVVAG